jgi:hypothetical protein
MSLEIEKVLKTLKSTLELNEGRGGKEWKRLGEKLYREWTEGGAIASPTGLLAGVNEDLCVYGVS